MKMFKIKMKILFYLWSTIMLAIKSAGNKHRMQPKTNLIPLLDKQNWICTFSTNNCGIVNEPKLLNFTLLTRRTLCHEKGIYYLNIISDSKIAGARLITPYFYQLNSVTINRCLTIKYMYFGDSFNKLVIWQQDRFNKKIWMENIFPNGYWRSIAVNLTLKPEITSRFFIEIHTGFDNGFLALSELAIKANCSH